MLEEEDLADEDESDYESDDEPSSRMSGPPDIVVIREGPADAPPPLSAASTSARAAHAPLKPPQAKPSTSGRKSAASVTGAQPKSPAAASGTVSLPRVGNVGATLPRE